MPHFGGTRRALVSGPASATVADWWTIAGQTCIAAYAPKGAADLTSSYINLANPGTYNATPNVAPTLSADGWVFAATANQWLDTGIIPANNQSYSMIVRFTGLTAGWDSYLIGLQNGSGKYFFLASLRGSNLLQYGNGGVQSIGLTGGLAAGNVAVAGNKAYRNGADESVSIGAWSGSPTYTILIGANRYGESSYGYAKGTVCAAAIYSTTLSAADVAALTTRMNAL